MKKKLILEEVKKMESKYCDLVWYAHSPSKYDTIPGVLENRTRIEEAYPDEVAKLENMANLDLEYGFYKGMLAGMRYILSIDAYGKEAADEDFPFTDT
jgi:hypothetical protein